MADYAPICLSVYSRINHLKRTINALKNDELSTASHLHVYSDAPKPGDEDKVLEIRKYLKSISGFKSITITERVQNLGINNSVSGINNILEKYGRIIFLEEDVVCAPGFLNFMNLALEKYGDNQLVNTISAYVEPFRKPTGYPYDAFFTHRFNAWGFATWKDRYFNSTHKIPSDEYDRLIRNRKCLREFKYLVGEDALKTLSRDVYEEIYAPDVRITYYQFMDNLLTVRPARSLTLNIGHDGTGIHCGITKKFDVELWDKIDTFRFPDKININHDYARALSRFRKLDHPVKKKINSILRYLLTRKNNTTE